ncbi:protein kinase [Streptomyces sp. DH12]|uniref:protein kinase domain-containing protein n=1 Tax=Streptomyces sp. DH12 TaxID=2857010 RepID=UPI001E5E6483|nr:protein kinase [Streptomyces sp. DH12]
MTVERGYRVGPWTVGRPLGAGAFGSVYAARRHGERDGGPAAAALKFLPTGTCTPRGLRHLRELAEREVGLLRRLRSPRLIRLYDVLTVDDPARPDLDGATVLVLEAARGSLAGLLASEPVPAAGPALLAQVCEGLAQLHRAGWVHGDLKPANVLLMGDGTVRLADFTTAAELEGSHAYGPAFATPDYAPPELLWPEVGERGVRTRPSSDVWAFGVLAHLVLTGTHPLPGGSPAARREAAARYARGEGELRLSPALPEPWRGIVADCLAPTHEARAVHDAASLLPRTLTAAGSTDAAGSTVRRSPRGRPPVPGRRAYGRRFATMSAVGAVAALAVAGLGLTLLPGEPRTGYARCPVGNVCFFTEPDGRGDMCAWVDSAHDWLGGPFPCPWARHTAPRSYYNNGLDRTQGAALTEVLLYARPRRAEPLRCLPLRTRGDLHPPVRARSHAWAARC